MILAQGVRGPGFNSQNSPCFFYREMLQEASGTSFKRACLDACFASPLPRCNTACLKACLEACLEACLILAKCLFCSTFHSINGNFLLHPSQARLSFAAISIASIEPCLEACLLLAKCLFCSPFHSINTSFHSLQACLEACPS